MSDRVLDSIRAAREVLELVHGVVEGHHCCFASRSHHGLREEDSSLAQLRQHRLDARTGLDQNHHRDGVAAEVEVRNLLSNAVVRNLEIPGFQIVNHLPAAISNGYRRVYERNPHSDGGFCCRRRLLDFAARFWWKRSGGSLCARRGASKSQCEPKSHPFGCDPSHFAHLSASTQVCVAKGVYLIRRMFSGRRCRKTRRFLQSRFV